MAECDHQPTGPLFDLDEFKIIRETVLHRAGAFPDDHKVHEIIRKLDRCIEILGGNIPQ